MGQILIKTPVTSNGRDPIMKDDKIVYKESIVEEAAKPIFEKINAKLPTHLKRIIAPVGEATPAKKSKNDKQV